MTKQQAEEIICGLLCAQAELYYFLEGFPEWPSVLEKQYKTLVDLIDELERQYKEEWEANDPFNTWSHAERWAKENRVFWKSYIKPEWKFELEARKNKIEQAKDNLRIWGERLSIILPGDDDTVVEIQVGDQILAQPKEGGPSIVYTVILPYRRQMVAETNEGKRRLFAKKTAKDYRPLPSGGSTLGDPYNWILKPKK